MMQDADPPGAPASGPPPSVVQAPVQRERPGRKGFLPFKTNTWDRIFISIVCFVAISLLWMRFVEAYLPLWGAVVISAALGYIIITRG